MCCSAADLFRCAKKTKKNHRGWISRRRIPERKTRRESVDRISCGTAEKAETEYRTWYGRSSHLVRKTPSHVVRKLNIALGAVQTIALGAETDHRTWCGTDHRTWCGTYHRTWCGTDHRTWCGTYHRTWCGNRTSHVARYGSSHLVRNIPSYLVRKPIIARGRSDCSARGGKSRVLQRGRLVQVRHENEEKRDASGSIEFPVGVFPKERRDASGSIEFLVALQKRRQSRRERVDRKPFLESRRETVDRIPCGSAEKTAIETRVGRSKAVFCKKKATVCKKKTFLKSRRGTVHRSHRGRKSMFNALSFTHLFMLCMCPKRQSGPRGIKPHAMHMSDNPCSLFSALNKPQESY